MMMMMWWRLFSFLNSLHTHTQFSLIFIIRNNLEMLAWWWRKLLEKYYRIVAAAAAKRFFSKYLFIICVYSIKLRTDECTSASFNAKKRRVHHHHHHKAFKDTTTHVQNYHIMCTMCHPPCPPDDDDATDASIA